MTESDPWDGDENYVENADGDDWRTKLTVNYDAGGGSYTLWATEPIKQAYWSHRREYNPDVTFGEKDGYYYASGEAEGGLNAFVTNGDLAAFSVDGDGHKVWHNGEILDPERWPNKPGGEVPDIGDGDDGAGGGNDYDVIKANGQLLWTDNFENNTIENLLIDVTNGGSITLAPRGHNPTIRNVGVKGTYRGTGFIVSIGGGQKATGTCTLENVYLGDGATQEGETFVHGPGGIFFHKSADCTLEATGVTVRGYSNNGMYCSNAPNVIWRDCYTVNCGVSHYRAKHGEMHNCVGYNTSSERHGASSGSERYGRVVWAWAPGPIDIHDSNISEGPSALRGLTAASGWGDSEINYHSGDYSGRTKGGSIQIDSSVGSNPNLVAPAAAPLSAEEAAGGGTPPEEPPEDPPEEPSEPTCEEQLDQANIRNEQLAEQISDYEAAFDDLEGTLGKGQENVTLLKNLLDQMRSKLPSRDN